MIRKSILILAAFFLAHFYDSIWQKISRDGIILSMKDTENNESKNTIACNNKSFIFTDKLAISKYNWLFAFLLGALTMYVTLSCSGMLSTGKYCILRGDMRTQLAPFIRDFCNRILHGESVYYSFSQFLGMDQTFYFAYCGIFSPFTLLFLLFPNADSNILMGVIVVLKAGLAAMAFQIFIKHAMKIDGIISLLFSIFYALCSFQVSCNLNNFVWMDALFIFPLIILFIYILSETGNPIPLCLSYTYIFIVQFYMGYMFGIVSFVFFLLGIWFLNHRVNLKKYILGYFSAVIISILLSAFIWAPTAYYLIHQYAEDATAFEPFFMNPITFYSQLFFSNNTYANTDFPSLYCGNITILLVPAFFLSFRNISGSNQCIKDNDLNIIKHRFPKEKLLYGGILIFLLLSCYVPFLYQLMNAFDAPDGWAFRYSYCISFFLCVLGAKGMQQLKVIPRSFFIFSLLINITLSVVDTAFFRTFDRNWIYCGIGILIWTIWTLLCIVMQKKSNSFLNPQIIGILCLLFAILECIGNGYSTYWKIPPGDTMTTKYEYKYWEQEQKNIADYLSSDSSFYRVDYEIDPIYNSDSYSSFYGISDFSTAENPAIRNALEKLGYATSVRVITDYGATPVTDMLLGVKYIVHENEAAPSSSLKEATEIEEFEYPLSIGYMVNDSVKDFTFGENAFENNERLLKSMTGVHNGTNYKNLSDSDPKKDSETCFLKDNHSVYQLIMPKEENGSDIVIINNGVSIQKEDNHYKFVTAKDPEESSIQFYIPSDRVPEGLIPCIYILNDKSLNRIDSMYITGPKENLTSFGGRISMSYIRPFDRIDNGYLINIYCNGKEEEEFKDLSFAFFDETALSKAYEILSSNQLQLTEFKSGYLKGFITVPKDNRNLLFTSIPYEKGWELTVNGETHEYISLLNGAFIGIDFEKPGNYEIEMKYKPGWLKEGIILSAIGLLLFFLYVVIFLGLYVKHHRPNKNSNQSSIL